MFGTYLFLSLMIQGASLAPDKFFPSAMWPWFTASLRKSCLSPAWRRSVRERWPPRR
jgi:hypothetical protein